MRRHEQLGRPSASGSGSSRCVECRFDVTHSSRSRRNVSEARLRVAIGDDGEIDLVGVDALEQVDRRLAHHRQFDARIGAREARHDLRQIAVGIIVRHAEPHAARQFGVGEGGERLDVELDDAARVIEQALRRLR